MSKHLHIDLETRSTVDLKKAGQNAYAEHATTDVWVCCYALDDEPVRAWFPGQDCPAVIVEHVAAGGDLYAHNSAFERLIWRHILTPRYGWPRPRLETFWCTAAMAAAMALPRALDDVARVLGLPVRKDKEGAALMMRMARPRQVKPDGALVWWDVPERIQRLAAYCAQDVEVERALTKRLRLLSPDEREVFLLDARINDRGVTLDMRLIEACAQVHDMIKRHGISRRVLVSWRPDDKTNRGRRTFPGLMTKLPRIRGTSRAGHAGAVFQISQIL